MKQPKIGLALGGGGARGMAHIGVLKVLEEHQIPIDLIVGTSIGALVGGAYALRPDARLLEMRIQRLLDSREFKDSGLERFTRQEPAENFFGQVAKYVRERIVINIAHSRLSVVSGWRLARIIDLILDNRNIEQTKIPLAIVATDLLRGEDVIFQQGSLRKAALASASIPGFLPPMEYNGFFLVDGAVTAPVPVLAARALGAEIVLAVDVGQGLDESHDSKNVVDVMFRTSAITNCKLKTLILQKADVIIRPQVGDVHWADFGQLDKLIAEGETATRAVIAEVSCAIEESWPFWKKLLKPKKNP